MNYRDLKKEVKDRFVKMYSKTRDEIESGSRQSFTLDEINAEIKQTRIERNEGKMKEVENKFVVAARLALDKVNAGDESEVPPYFTVDQWKTHNALVLDEARHPEYKWCLACDAMHPTSSE